MNSVAVIVGVNDYKGDLSPLTSPVNDAVDFRDTLFKLGLVGAAYDIRLFTAPAVADAKLATYSNVTGELRALYRHGETVDRMFVFFSGHGLSAYEDGSHTRLKPVIAPVDVESLDDDGRNLIDLDELRKYFELAGPQEQLYFIDACRDLNYDHYPSVGVLGWGGGPGAGVRPGAARAQATLWAVAPLYTAQGRRGENGVMTSHLLEALTSDRVAVAFSAETAQYIVTMESIKAYVEERVRAAVETESAWKAKYMVPLLDHHGSDVLPLRVLEDVPSVPLTVHVVPDSAAPATDVRLALAGHLLHSYPPRANHETIALPPQPYLLTARSTAGDAEPSREVVDVRRVSEATIRVTPSGDTTVTVPSPVLLGPYSPAVDVVSTVGTREEALRGDAPTTGGTVVADALEPQVIVDLVGLEPPYRRYAAQRSLRMQVPRGPYRISFRLGADVFNSRVIYVADGEALRVRPTIEVSPLLVELTGTAGQAPDELLVVSESIGPMQAGALATILPIIGIKPFDERRELFHQFDDAFAGRYRSADEFAGRPLSVVVALDGDGWRRPPGEVLQSITCEVTVLGSAISAKLDPLPTADFRAAASRPSDRIGTLLMMAPIQPCQLSLRIPQFGRLNLWCGSIARRATVVTVRVGPDGSLDMAQNLLRIPGWDYPDEIVPNIAYGKLLRQLQIGQRLFRSGELLRVLAGDIPDDETRGLWRELLYAKWTDPILSCMAYHAWRAASEHRGEPARRDEASWLLRQTAMNLRRYFGSLADSQVVYATEFSDQRNAVMAQLIDEDAIPILAVNARRLADFAEEQGRHDATVVRVTRVLLMDQVWTAFVS